MAVRQDRHSQSRSRSPGCFESESSDTVWTFRYLSLQFRMVGNVHGGERADDFHLQLLLLRIFERFAYELAGEAASSLRGRYFGVPQDDPALRIDFIRQVTDLGLAFYFEALRLYVRQIGAHSNP